MLSCFIAFAFCNYKSLFDIKYESTYVLLFYNVVYQVKLSLVFMFTVYYTRSCWQLQVWLRQWLLFVDRCYLLLLHLCTSTWKKFKKSESSWKRCMRIIAPRTDHQKDSWLVTSPASDTRMPKVYSTSCVYPVVVWSLPLLPNNHFSITILSQQLWRLAWKYQNGKE